MSGVNRAIVVNKMPAFANIAVATFDRALANVSAEGLRLSKLQAPHDQGALWASGTIKRKGVMKFEVSYNTPYARKWEFTEPKNGFTHPGAKSHYLQDPMDLVTSPSYFNAKLVIAGKSVKV